MDTNNDLMKHIKLTGERAKLDAKANGTYVVYKDGASINTLTCQIGSYLFKII